MLTPIKTEHELNKELKLHKANTPDDPCYILFYSMWTRENRNTIRMFEDIQEPDELKRFSVNLGEIPHASVIFGVTSSPTLVVIEDNRVYKLDRLCEIIAKMEQLDHSGIKDKSSKYFF